MNNINRLKNALRNAQKKNMKIVKMLTGVAWGGSMKENKRG